MNAQHLSNHIMALKKYKQEILSQYMNTNKGSKIERALNSKLLLLDDEIEFVKQLLIKHMNL